MPEKPNHLRRPGVLGTACFIVGGIALIAGYDLWALRRHGKDATITGVMQAAAKTFPVLTAATAFSMGGLFGHFFLTGRKNPSGPD